MHDVKRRKLNQHLDIDSFDICVPKKSKLFGQDWTKKENWKKYLRTLCDDPRRTREVNKQREASGKDSAVDLKGPARHKTCPTVEPCDILREEGNVPEKKAGWRLRGRFALRHALEVHKKVLQSYLQQEGIEAVDVGFARVEKHGAFANLLALRLHSTYKEYWRRRTAGNSPNKPDGVRSFKQMRSLSSVLYLLSDGTKVTDDAEDAEDSKHAALEKYAKRSGIPFEVAQSEWAHGDFRHYPVGEFHTDDLSLCCSREMLGEEEVEEACRLCVCGVPIDIVGRSYYPANHHPGGGRMGVFTQPPQTSLDLSPQELLLTGRSRINPLVGGVSIGSRTGQAGTLGTIVWDRTDGEPCILSNWHVLAGSVAATVGQPCYQPSLFDGGTEADTVGYLKRWHIGIEGDAAIAELSGGRNYASAGILGMWNPVSGVRSPKLKLEVRKWGRTTGFTEGFIDGIRLAVNLDYGNGTILHFQNQFHIAPLYFGEMVSHVGDSGSLIITRQYLDEESQQFADAKANLDDYTKLVKQVKKALLHVAQEKEGLSKLKNALEGASWGSPGETRASLRALCGQADLPDQDSEETEEDIDQVFRAALKLDDDGFQVFKEFLYSIGVDISAGKKHLTELQSRRKRRANYAVGLLFAGDTPGSPLGEYALASDISNLSRELDFSLQPVFEPRSSFRKLRTERENFARSFNPSRQRLAPGDVADDDRGGGQQPIPSPLQTGGGGG